MAAVDASLVTVHEVWSEAGTNGRRHKVMDVTLALTSQGGLTNNIPASLFGMQRIMDARGFRTTASVRMEFGPNYSATLNGTLLVAYDNTNATDATRNSPADVTATVRGLVIGLE